MPIGHAALVVEALPHEEDARLNLAQSDGQIAHSRSDPTNLPLAEHGASAKQLAALPLPTDAAAWDRGARLARAAQLASSDDERAALLVECAEAMCASYDCGEGGVLEWWRERAGLTA